MPVYTKKAKYQQIAESLRSRLRSGEMKAGDRLPSFAQMYREHGASVATMCRVYDLLESEGLIKRRGGSGVYVTEPDNRTATGKLGLALQVDSLAHPYMIDLLMGVRREAERNGMELLMLNEEEKTITQGKVDAVLLHCEVPEALQFNLPAGLPHVLLFQHSSKFTCVMPDDFEGAKLATRHLLDLGHQQIAYLLHTKQDFISRQRLAGFYAAHEEAEIIIGENQVKFLAKTSHQNYREAGAAAMKAWLQENWRDLGCTAMLAHNDSTAIGMMKALTEAGLRIPHDVSIIGFDGTEISEFCSPCLTTIKVPLEEIGARAVKVLLAQIREGIEAPEKIVLPVHLKAGNSVAARELEHKVEKVLSYV